MASATTAARGTASGLVRATVQARAKATMGLATMWVAECSTLMDNRY